MKAEKLVDGPGTRDSIFDGSPGEFPRYGALNVIDAVIEKTPMPDFDRLYPKLYSNVVEVPDDPMAIGLQAFNGMFQQVSACYRAVTNIRMDAIAVKTEWESIQIEYNSLIEGSRRLARDSDEYATCKNAEQRKACEDGFIGTKYLDLAVTIDIAIQRCGRFLEACYLKSKEVEMVMTALEKQTAILKMEMELTPKES